MNRLADETSPYLQQHKDNPVNWYPWGAEAFDEARRRDVPVLLSVGYSACHWCHVMAHESFEDEATAAVMNERFVNVKVDREERPDVDAVYMEAVQAMSGHGGWPMTVFMTPDAKPFLAGTYFPKEGQRGRPSFLQVMDAVDEAWRDHRDDVIAQGEQLVAALRARSSTLLDDGHGHGVSPDIVRAAIEELRSSHDDEWGGFGRAPKFPQTFALDLLLRDAGARDAVETSLDAMASGGIYDHVGGGFARYSVDAFWMVPHFEKMLYDQALLLRAYTHGWQVLGHDRWRQVAAEIVTYALRDLRHADGGFYAAEDADSEGEEGRFYLWRAEEIEDVVGATVAPAVFEWYGVTKAGNFEGSNILHRPVRGDLDRPTEIEEARRALFEAREKRVRPGLDDKVLTEWNALFISSLAEAGAAFGRNDWVEAAERAADFLFDHLRRDDGRWLRSWQGGRARHLAYAADHAALVDACTRLAEASGEARWIERAKTVAHTMLELFWDDDEGGLFTTAHDAEPLIVRQKDIFDGATPSANSVAALALLRLGALTGDDRLRSHGERILEVLAAPTAHHPTAFTAAIAAIELASGGVTEIVITGSRPDLVEAVQRRWLPNAVLAWGDRYDSPLWEGRTDTGGAGTAYVCQHYACAAPVTTPAALTTALDALTP